MSKIKKVITSTNLLCLFIIICPILDVASFLFRNKYNTNISISTVIRPIIPICVFLCLFFKKNEISNKLKIVGAILLYIMYACAHLLIYSKMKTGCSYGTVLHEAQYLVNYSFLVFNLYIYKKVFNNNNIQKLHGAIAIALLIYISSIYISFITHTSSTTYIEGIGYKGWLESGNSISTIFIIGTFIVMSFITKIESTFKRILILGEVLLIGIFLMLMIGTRAGLLGFIIAIFCFIMAQVFEKLISKASINKSSFFIMLTILMLLIVTVILAGSVTIKRRQHLKNMENTILDETTGEVSNITGDLTKYRNKIINNEVNDEFMSVSQRKSILDLYDIAKKHRISNTNMRMQQLIYHVALVKNQKNLLLLLMGNGYLINTNELVWEMELPAILLNFGIVGFGLYIMPFIIMFVNAMIIIVKKIKKVDTECIMLIAAVLMSFVLSTISGYTFFNSSAMIVIIIANVLLNNKINKIKEEIA